MTLKICGLNYSHNKESIIVGTIYFHPNNNVNEFSRNLENTIIKLNNQRQTFYVLGDFNINLLSDSGLTHAYVNSLTSLGVHCLSLLDLCIIALLLFWIISILMIISITYILVFSH